MSVFLFLSSSYRLLPLALDEIHAGHTNPTLPRDTPPAAPTSLVPAAARWGSHALALPRRPPRHALLLLDRGGRAEVEVELPCMRSRLPWSGGAPARASAATERSSHARGWAELPAVRARPTRTALGSRSAGSCSP